MKQVLVSTRGVATLPVVWKLLTVLALTCFVAPGLAAQPLLPQALAQPAAARSDMQAFAAELEQIRQDLKIPGMSAAIVQDQQIVWAQGFGYADLERQLPASPDTPYHLASVTKPIAATLMMQLVEEGRLSLDDPVLQYGIHLPERGVTVWHLLTHTSAGTPGSEHNYDGNRYSLLARVFSSACGAPFGECLAGRFIDPLDMEHTAPNPAWAGAGWSGYVAALGWGEANRNFPQVYRDLAHPYQFDVAYNNVPGAYPLHFSPAAGLMASVTDIARFDIALDRNLLLRPETKAAMFAPAVANSGQQLIYGLGWYSQWFQGTRLVWHSGGWPPSVSSLYLKAPDQDLTFIVLANNYNLTRPYPLGDGDVLFSTPALAFYKHFVFPRQFSRIVPGVDWSVGEGELVTQLRQTTDPEVRAVLERELWSYRQLYASVGEEEQANRLGHVHRAAFPEFSRSRLDASATSTTTARPEPQSVALLPAQVSTLCRLLFGWLILTGLALVVLSFSSRHSPSDSRALPLTWFLIILLFGLVGLAAYRKSAGCEHSGQPPEGSLPWRLALRPALYRATGNMAGLLLALLAITFYFPYLQQAAVPAIVVMFLVNWLVFSAPADSVERRQAYLLSVRETFTSAIAATFFVLLGALPTMIYLSESLLLNVTPDSPLFLIVLLLTGAAGAITVYPYTVWSLRRSRDKLVERVTATAV